MARFEDCIEYLLEDEGDVYSDDPNDGGGPTKYGITIADLKAWRKNPATTAQDVADLQKSEALQIYKTDYWDRMNIDQVINRIVATALFDQGVNCGPGVAVMRAQAALIELGFSVAKDGVNGPQTQNALNAADVKKFIYQYFLQTQNRYIQICKNDRTQIKFLAGWLARSQKMIALIL